MLVPRPARPMMSRVVLLSQSSTSKHWVLTFDSAISLSHRSAMCSDLAQKMGINDRMEVMEKAGVKALRWTTWACPSASKTPSPRMGAIHLRARSGLG